MNLSTRVVRQVALLSLLIVIAPMVAFPEQFGTGLGKASLLNFVLELVFYCAAIYFLNKTNSLPSLLKAGAICLVYRVLVGVLLGLFVTLMYSMSIKVSLTLSMFGYLPGLFLHIAATPFILRPLLSADRPRSVDKPIPKPEASAAAPGGMTNVAASRDHRPPDDSRFKPPTRPAAKATPAIAKGTDVARNNGFDQATHHIGAEPSVKVAVLVDQEGLCLSYFSRGDISHEEYAPFAVQYFEQLQPSLDRNSMGAPEKMVLTLNEHKLFLARSGLFHLLVVAERQADDLLSIRVTQGLEIAKKYFADRYGEKSPVKPEKAYV
ncbi:MAG: hypothetical protein P1R58_12030 [bacterium]|nr:hypothetical protein [bacterium]